MTRTVWRILGVEVFSRESDEEPAEEPLTAADNGGTTYSERTDVTLGFGGIERTEGWEDRRRAPAIDTEPYGGKA